MSDADREIEERERDVDVAQMQLRDAQHAIEEGDFVRAVESVGSVASFCARAATRDAPVASVTVDRVGNHDSEHIAVSPGEQSEIEIHGKATIHIAGEKRYRGDDDV